ncbi:unnamed protein product, partial [Mesorhabditis spiculigera]
MDTEKPLGVLRARFLLLVGGTFGWHRLYLRQVPEAFIYFSTFGVFLLGLFYDSFYINSEVREYNERIEGRQNEEKAKLAKQPNVSEHAPFSLTRNLYAILYGCYLGLFTWLAGNISFGGTLADNFPLLIAVAGAISTGVFLIGNSGRMTMKAAQIWISTFTLLAITARLAESSPARSIFFSAITGTLVGNRGIKRLSPRDRPYSYKHYVFWCSLWLFCLCLLGTGACRQLLEKRVSFHSNEARVSSTLATLLYDRPFIHSRANVLCISLLYLTDREEVDNLKNNRLQIYGNDWHVILAVHSLCLHADGPWQPVLEPWFYTVEEEEEDEHEHEDEDEE